MMWQGANEATVSMQIVELRLGTRVYFVMWHWWGQHEYCWEISNNCPYLHTQAAILLIVCCSSHPIFLYHIIWPKPTSCFRSRRVLWVLGSKALLCLLPCPSAPAPSHWVSALPSAPCQQHTQPHNFLHSYQKNASIYLTSEAWCMAASFWTFGQA